MVKLFLIAMLFQLPVVALAVINSRQDREEREGDEKKERGQGLFLEILCECYQKGKGRGLSGGYDNSLAFCALAECINRLRRGDEVEIGTAALAIEMLGLGLVETEDGGIKVVEIEPGAGE